MHVWTPSVRTTEFHKNLPIMKCAKCGTETYEFFPSHNSLSHNIHEHKPEKTPVFEAYDDFVYPIPDHFGYIKKFYTCDEIVVISTLSE